METTATGLHVAGNTLPEGERSILDALAREINRHKDNVVHSVLQIGRCFQEAREICPRGEWGRWTVEKTGFDTRTVNQYIQVYERFSGADLPNVGIGHLVKLLALPEGTEKTFLEQHDIEKMSVRELARTVREENPPQGGETSLSPAGDISPFRGEPKGAPGGDRKAPRNAPDGNPITESAEGVPGATGKPPADAAQSAGEKTSLSPAGDISPFRGEGEEPPPEWKAERARQLETIEVLKGQVADWYTQSKEKDAKIRRLEKQVEENEAFLKLLDRQNQQQTDMALEEMSRRARDAPVEETFTPATLSRAVNRLMGECARLPMMRSEFLQMGWEARQAYGQELDVLEEWLQGARNAVGLVKAEGGVLA